jgi:hypothetical protein
VFSNRPWPSKRVNIIFELWPWSEIPACSETSRLPPMPGRARQLLGNATCLSAFLIHSRMSELPLVAQLVPSPFQAPSACLGVPVLQKELLRALLGSGALHVLAIKRSSKSTRYLIGTSAAPANRTPHSHDRWAPRPGRVPRRPGNQAGEGANARSPLTAPRGLSGERPRFDLLAPRRPEGEGNQDVGAATQGRAAAPGRARRERVLTPRSVRMPPERGWRHSNRGWEDWRECDAERAKCANFVTFGRDPLTRTCVRVRLGSCSSIDPVRSTRSDTAAPRR